MVNTILFQRVSDHDPSNILTPASRQDKGVTLIELLAAMAIIAVLLGLAIPAIQSARECARGSQCQAHLKSLGLAIHAYHNVYGGLPMGELPGYFSPHISILPYLDQPALFNSINFVVLNEPGQGPRGRRPTWVDAISQTVGIAVIDVYACPSEPYGDPPEREWTDEGLSYRSSNYAWCSGTWWPRAKSWDGLFGRSISDTPQRPSPPDPPLGLIRFSACRDGLSTTLLVSEVALGPLAPEPLIGRTPVSECYRVPELSVTAPLEEARALCSTVDWRTSPLPLSGRWRYKGYPWVEGTLWRNWFNSAVSPNGNCCVNDQLDPGNRDRNWWLMIKPASSYHPNAVNACMADGSVRAVKSTIAPSIWMALSTRAGNEIIGGGY